MPVGLTCAHIPFTCVVIPMRRRSCGVRAPLELRSDRSVAPQTRPARARLANRSGSVSAPFARRLSAKRAAFGRRSRAAQELRGRSGPILAHTPMEATAATFDITTSNRTRPLRPKIAPSGSRPLLTGLATTFDHPSFAISAVSSQAPTLGTTLPSPSWRTTKAGSSSTQIRARNAMCSATNPRPKLGRWWPRVAHIWPTIL